MTQAPRERAIHDPVLPKSLTAQDHPQIDPFNDPSTSLQQKVLHNRYLLICPFLKNLYQNKKNFIHFFRLLRDSMKYSYTINQYFPYFISKNVVFNRENKSKWFYKHLFQDIAYKNFIQNIQKTIHKNKIIMNVLR